LILQVLRGDCKGGPNMVEKNLKNNPHHEKKTIEKETPNS
jgi:hypothetical protein